jgi:hypothetical protein
VKAKHRSPRTALLAEENRGLLLDIVVFVLNLFLMRSLTTYAVDVFRFADAGEPLAKFALLFACVLMWVLPAAAAVLKRWHFHQRLQAENRTFDLDSKLSGCLFNPIFYFCLNLVLVSAILAGASQFLFGNLVMKNGALFVPLVIAGLIATIFQTYLIYRYFSKPNKPPRYPFLRQPEAERLGDICIFLNMVLFQLAWNMLTLADLGRPGGFTEFAGRLFFLCFIALLIYFPPRMLYLAEDVDRPRTWVMMLLANSPVIVRALIGTNEWR